MPDNLLDAIEFRIDARPTRQQLDDLALSVGWSEFGEDYPRMFDGHAVTASAWTAMGQLVGWTAIVSDNVRHAFLADVIVHRDFQRRGIGREVILKAIEQMALRGITYLHVDCAPDRAGFYARCGFTIGAGGWLDPTKRPLRGEAC